ncbi:MAG: YebC/PmpR family DNA-binding transcriptional regulator, partial [Gammaproteobacteria bacterium]|nr:YebC/PmpR family DNA-binding transcriptional regulator [Gammaproteobacteria bacterium]
LTDPADFEQVREVMDKSGPDIDNAEVTMLASTQATLNEREAGSMIKMLEVLEDLDDVQNVYSNAEIPDEILAALDS